MVELGEKASTSGREAQRLHRLLAAVETRANYAARNAETVIKELREASAASEEMEGDLQHLLSVVIDKALSLQLTSTELKEQVASLQAGNTEERRAKQDYHLGLTAALATIGSLSTQNNQQEQQLQSARADHRTAARYLALSRSDASASIKKLRQCEEALSASQAQSAELQKSILAANNESSRLGKQVQAAEALQLEAASHQQELQQQLEALRAAVARCQQDKATMVRSTTCPFIFPTWIHSCCALICHTKPCSMIVRHLASQQLTWHTSRFALTSVVMFEVLL